MGIYTRRGDVGETSVIGARVSKDHVRVEAYGTVDEANSFVGDAIARMRERDAERYDDMVEILTQIQQELFDVGAIWRWSMANVRIKSHLNMWNDWSGGWMRF